MTAPEEDFYDLDAAAAEQRAKRKPFRFRWGGHMWEMSNAFNLDLSLIESAEAGDVEAIRGALRDGLGDQHDAFMGQGLDLGALVLLFNQWIAASGSTPGESAASSGSSPSTGRPSKRTSKGSTGSASARRSGGGRGSVVRPVSS